MYSCRQHIPDLLNEEKQRIADALNGKTIFVIAYRRGEGKYFNILVGDLSIPSSVLLDNSVNNKIVC